VALSPDGRRAVVARSEGGSATSVWVKQLDHGAATKLVDRGSLPNWSSDGATVFFATDSAIMQVPSDGSRMPSTFRRIPARVFSLIATRDGNWVVYATLTNAYAARTSDTTTLSLTDSGQVRRLTVSPDSRWVAYDSDKSGRWEVYVRPFPDTRLSKHQVSTSGGLMPEWSRDGRELFYVEEALGSLVAVPIVPGKSFVTGEPTRLFKPNSNRTVNNRFNQAPDGRFLMIHGVGSDASRPDELVLVENFTEELKAKVKR
jgi:Tol biopolymer transport system component